MVFRNTWARAALCTLHPAENAGRSLLALPLAGDLARLFFKHRPQMQAYPRPLRLPAFG